MNNLNRILAAIFALILSTEADIPVSCYFEDVAGTWKFQESGYSTKGPATCENAIMDFSRQNIIQLLYPNVALDKFGNRGKWTLIYNQDPHHVTSVCEQTVPGWSHDKYVRDWSCFVGHKIKTPLSRIKPAETKTYNIMTNYKNAFYSEYRFLNNMKFIDKINKAQTNWYAVAYPEFEDLSRLEMLLKLGGIKSKIMNRPKPARITEHVQNLANELPDQFDWRNVSGSCGSCYAFASAAMHEARYRILTDNQHQPVFSPQDIIECSQYSQGCDGGFPYLIGGKYAEDFGFVTEQCNPYSGIIKDEAICTTDPQCKRHYATDYQYVGGFYGATNEPLMRLALVNSGPLAVGIEAFDDLIHYRGGIYHHTKIHDDSNFPTKWNPFELTNHAVLIVGYGVDKKSNIPYWIVKNSWGTNWGEHGYFRIKRGVDECGIESLAVQATPIPTF
ncbi:Dipeptidyl peptidase 1 [Trichinella britovi]|uniref:dipeptidyl-peptidase I n=1 Tax=Trichinella britovi TaxID=45882 RepID=A0A0V1CTQ1_TRIBR|nr:Dipeptidyl peptidase 1 [Trichinella britovi]